MEILLKICKVLFFPFYFIALIVKPFLKYILIFMIFVLVWELISIFIWEKKRKVLKSKIGYSQLVVVEAPLKRVNIGATHTVTERDFANDRVEYDYDPFSNTKTTTYINAYKKKQVKDEDKGVYSYFYNGKTYEYETSYSGDSIRLYLESSKPSKAYSFADIFNDKIGNEKKKNFIDCLLSIGTIVLMMLMVK